MDYGGTDRRRTKKDLKRKAIARGYKRGGAFRSMEVNEVSDTEEVGKDDNSKKKKTPGKSKKKKY
ncbi:MAG: hypothetical protein ACI83O_000462 [Patescibacteria group bacterium]|jgi:hypothetical protein